MRWLGLIDFAWRDDSITLLRMWTSSVFYLQNSIFSFYWEIRAFVWIWFIFLVLLCQIKWHFICLNKFLIIINILLLNVFSFNFCNLRLNIIAFKLALWSFSILLECFCQCLTSSFCQQTAFYCIFLLLCEVSLFASVRLCFYVGLILQSCLPFVACYRRNILTSVLNCCFRSSIVNNLNSSFLETSNLSALIGCWSSFVICWKIHWLVTTISRRYIFLVDQRIGDESTWQCMSSSCIFGCVYLNW